MIRRAERGDVDAVLALVQAAYRGDASRAGWTTEADLLDGQRTDEAGVSAALPDLLVAVQEGEVVGCCAVTHQGGHSYFGMFAVRPTLQAGGVGSALLAAAEDEARAQGSERMEMTVLRQRAELIAYYERRGYAVTTQSRPFPYGDERFGIPRRDDLEFVVLIKEM